MGQISIINHLACMWRVRMKEEENMKEGGSNGKWDQKIVRESIVTA